MMSTKVVLYRFIIQLVELGRGENGKSRLVGIDNVDG